MYVGESGHEIIYFNCRRWIDARNDKSRIQLVTWWSERAKLGSYNLTGIKLSSRRDCAGQPSCCLCWQSTAGVGDGWGRARSISIVVQPDTHLLQAHLCFNPVGDILACEDCQGLTAGALDVLGLNIVPVRTRWGVAAPSDAQQLTCSESAFPIRNEKLN